MNIELLPGFEEEIWKAVDGWNGYYEVSNAGAVRSMDRIVKKADGSTALYKGRRLKSSDNSTGYQCIVLSRSSRTTPATIHRLVGKAFLTPDPSRVFINHKDGNRANNAVINLEWVTLRENSRHAVDILGRMRGDQAPSAKLSDEQVMAIRAAKGTQPELGERFGVSSSNVGMIRRGRTWKHLPLGEHNSVLRHSVTWDGEVVSLNELAKRTGVSRGMLYERIIQLRWSVERAVKERTHIECRRPRLLCRMAKDHTQPNDRR